ncbi:MAG TPA: biotin--[acetyl-CoA-carboxylase] ligase [Candidatus Intestinimonas pullistercoris]|uniref:Bifunctional ligase/repressor BirA n=1 Tax=Candidatus Intestinimonas pullistercoris TaxID=2838623 RepID=A0A9D2T0E9_9FIRM|nr:biotin--[acetyl-CoA-carboxylase] ligase [uncultured Intestinimonas sp.]HJC40515.1 biotin--[acetyl-CoA-carboxylase] ligase [Candidatus Intestinimonas pullistercoris]
MLQDDILALLRSDPGGYRSGEAMSRTLGVSRAAVWKAVEALRSAGYEIVSAPNRGYCLSAAPDDLRAGEIAAALSGRVIGREVVCLDTVDSTNSEVKRRSAGGAPEGLAVLADEQTGGRGRRGNAFQSLRGKGLYCSVLLRPACPPEDLGQLTAWTAVAVCRAIRDCCGAECGIKWTNDLILGGRKVCGILTELELEAESAAALSVVIGVGINVGQTAGDFGPELSPIATSLSQALGRSVRRAELAACLLRALDEMYAAFPGGKAEYLAEYRRRCVTTGREVALLRGEERVTAFAQEVDDQFSLVCRLPGGRVETVTAGEVSVRGLLGYV